ncbi:hypothetical protein [Cohnella endophytica]|nr:hypothetical protein [Cohnella endophytica]
MLLLAIVGIMTTMACASSVSTGMMSGLGKVLAFVVAVIGITLGTTIGTIMASAGSTAKAYISVAVIAAALTMIVGNRKARKAINKANIQRDL